MSEEARCHHNFIRPINKDVYFCKICKCEITSLQAIELFDEAKKDRSFLLERELAEARKANKAFKDSCADLEVRNGDLKTELELANLECWRLAKLVNGDTAILIQDLERDLKNAREALVLSIEEHQEIISRIKLVLKPFTETQDHICQEKERIAARQALTPEPPRGE